MAGHTTAMPARHFTKIASAPVAAPSNTASSPPVADQPLREWTDSTGQHKVKAKFLSVEGDVVSLQREDGRQVQIPLSRLCAADQTLIKNLQAKPQPDSPFSVVDNGGPAAPPAVAEPKTIEVDWSQSRELNPAPTGSDWKLDATAATAADTQAPVRPVAFSRNSFKYDGFTLNPASQRVLLTLIRKAGEGNLIGRYVLADMAKGQTQEFQVPGLDTTLRAIALNDAGSTALVRRCEWGFGKKDRLELWSFAASGVKRHIRWIPYAKGSGQGRDVVWARFLKDDRLVTVSGGGKLAVWDTVTATPICHLAIKGGSTPGISSDGRYIVYSRGDDIGVLDTEKQEVVAAQNAGSSLTWPHLRVSPSGTRIACLDHTRLKVWDFQTGELLIDIAWFKTLELPVVLRKPTGSSTLGTTEVTTAGLR
jgi:hypothetical protein